MDARFMRAALREAGRGVGRTAPNPPVGAVVVKDGEIVGKGHHARAGLPHAEVVALEDAGDAATGADLYVTLEPCCHHGRTPPCTDAIIRAGIARVLFAVSDPDPKVAGRGERLLCEAGIETHQGLLADRAEDLYEAYFTHRRTGRPLGVLKMASTLDGKVATATGESRWITGERARKHVHRLRDRNDAVVVGVGTVLADDPQLTTRVRGGRDALRVVVDSTARTPPSAQVIASDSPAGCLIATTAAASGERLEALREAGAELVVLPSEDARVDLAALWRLLGVRGCLSVLVEGGPELAASALESGVIDKLLLFLAPTIIGGSDAKPVFAGAGVERLAEATQLEIRRVRRFGVDLMIEARPCSRDS